MFNMYIGCLDKLFWEVPIQDFALQIYSLEENKGPRNNFMENFVASPQWILHRQLFCPPNSTYFGIPKSDFFFFYPVIPPLRVASIFLGHIRKYFQGEILGEYELILCFLPFIILSPVLVAIHCLT